MLRQISFARFERCGSWGTGAVSALALAYLLLLPGSANAQTAVFGAQQDNTMYTCTLEFPASCRSNGAGEFFVIDLFNAGGRRGLIQFDIDGTPQTGGAIPPGSTITSVVLQLHESRVNGAGEIPTPSPVPPGNVTITALAQDWGQGTSDALGDNFVGLGAVPSIGDATWVHRFYDTMNWRHAGGTCLPNTACILATASATTDIQVVVPAFVTWGSTPGMVADVQAWLDAPSGNFGWIIQTLENPVRLDTRENADPNFRPMLTVNYTVPEPAQIASLTAALTTIGALARRRRRDSHQR